MTCAKIGLTILAAVILVFTLWPQIASQSVNQWVVSILAILVVVLTWVGTECRFCMDRPKMKSKK